MTLRPRLVMKAALSLLVAISCTAVSLTTAPEASAAIRCNSNGSPSWDSGRFYNNSSRPFKVKGDRLINGAWQDDVWVWVNPGESAYGTHRMCDADFFTTYYRFWIYEYGAYYPKASGYVQKIGPSSWECRRGYIQGQSYPEPFCS